jgi:hypothetical protein
MDHVMGIGVCAIMTVKALAIEIADLNSAPLEEES